MTETDSEIQTLRKEQNEMYINEKYLAKSDLVQNCEIDRLRELAEREKGCEYCQNKNGQNTDIWRGNRLSVGYGIYREIHYCPMCGKRLEEARKDDE